MVSDQISLRDIVVFIEEKENLGEFDHLKSKVDAVMRKIIDSVNSNGVLGFSNDLLMDMFSLRITLITDRNFMSFFFERS